MRSTRKRPAQLRAGHRGHPFVNAASSAAVVSKLHQQRTRIKGPFGGGTGLVGSAGSATKCMHHQHRRQTYLQQECEVVGLLDPDAGRVRHRMSATDPLIANSDPVIQTRARQALAAYRSVVRCRKTTPVNASPMRPALPQEKQISRRHQHPGRHCHLAMRMPANAVRSPNPDADTLSVPQRKCLRRV